MEDDEIVALFLARSEGAVAAVSEKYGGYCGAIARRILCAPEDAEECVNDTWLRAWDSIPPAIPKDLRAYLGKITRNLALKRLRAAGAAKRGGGEADLALSELAECVSDGETPEDALLRQQVAASVNRFLGSLSREQRAVFVLRYWYLYSAREISAQTGLRENTIRSMLFRLRKRLKTHLEQEDVL